MSKAVLDKILLSVGNTVQMAGAFYVGDGKAYLCLFPEDGGDLPPVAFRDSKTGASVEVTALSMDVEDWKRFMRQTDLMETEVLTRASDGSIAKALVRKSQRQIDTACSWNVFRRDGYACRYCGADSVPLTVDHVVCWEEGGPSEEPNLVSACRRCNKLRGNAQYEDWLAGPDYARVSAGLGPAARALNEALVDRLPTIQRRLHARSR